MNPSIGHGYDYLVRFGLDPGFVVNPDGLVVGRRFATEGVHPFDEVAWERGPVEITAADGTVIFWEPSFEAPASWSVQARTIVASKFAYGRSGDADRETSARQVVGRVALRIARWGDEQGYFRTHGDAADFCYELMWLFIHQYYSMNSPVWFNVGHDLMGRPSPTPDNWVVPPRRGDAEPEPTRNDDVHSHPQVHACFIQSVDDSIAGIMALAAAEATVFKYGSGTGTDLSVIRSTRERVSGGGRPSGPVSFMRIYDAVAGTVKSGGKSRRAAKIQTLRCSHPDILEFINCKPEEEAKARALIAAGYPGDFNGSAYGTVAYQNSNLSVRVTDEFMTLAESGGPGPDWPLVSVTTGETVDRVSASNLLDAIAASADVCGDPAVQFEDEFTRWHTTPASGPINSTNPCLGGATLIDTTEGPICVADLARRHAAGSSLPMVYCWDRDVDLPAIRPIVRAFVTKEVDRLVEVVTRKGLTFRVTPDHQFLMHDGHYVEAQDLRTGMRLRKVGRWSNDLRRGDIYINHRETSAVPNGTVRESRWIWDQVYGPIPDGFEVHHKDEDPTNNRLSNLELRPSVVHQSDHSRGDSNPRYIDAADELLVDVWDRVSASGPVTSSRWTRFVARSEYRGRVPVARGDGRIRGKSWAEFAAEVESIRDRVNDRVEAVSDVALDGPVPVYDLMVMGTANFAAFGQSKNGSYLHSIILKNCGEYASNDDSGCDLASHRLTAFVDDAGRFDADRYVAGVRLSIIAQDIVIGPAGYPTAKIAAGVMRHRQLGLGYADLGALLMRSGLPYDSPAGRRLCGAITALMTGAAYAMSAELARRLGPFPGWHDNARAMNGVVRRHHDALIDLNSIYENDDQVSRIAARAHVEWDAAIEVGSVHGYRNSQTTLIAPTGTIGFMMDCDTFGIEPEALLVKHKLLAGGGTMKIVNRSVGPALAAIGYDGRDQAKILDHIENYDTIEDVNLGNPVRTPLASSDMAVFDCALPSANGLDRRQISIHGHLGMMAAAQPFLSGAISKTVNLPREADAGLIRSIYISAWRQHLKSVTVYRDGSKGSQPLSASAPADATRNGVVVPAVTPEFRAAARYDEPTVGLVTAGVSLADVMDSPLDVRSLVEAVAARSLSAVPSSNGARTARADPVRRRLPETRRSVNHHFEVVGANGVFDGYISVGTYDDGSPGEVFITSAKGGSTLNGMLDVVGTMTSMLLQYGVPLDVLCRKFAHVGFEPAGPTRTPEVAFAKSIVDYVFRWVALNFSEDLKLEWRRPDGPAPSADAVATGNVCAECGGANLVREGSTCWRCLNCFWVSGGCGG